MDIETLAPSAEVTRYEADLNGPEVRVFIELVNGRHSVIVFLSVAQEAVAWWQTQSGDGITMVERDSLQAWFFPWAQVQRVHYEQLSHG